MCTLGENIFVDFSSVQEFLFCTLVGLYQLTQLFIALTNSFIPLFLVLEFRNRKKEIESESEKEKEILMHAWLEMVMGWDGMGFDNPIFIPPT